MIFQNDNNENPHIHVRSNSVEHGKRTAGFSSQKHLRYLFRADDHNLGPAFYTIHQISYYAKIKIFKLSNRLKIGRNSSRMK